MCSGENYAYVNIVATQQKSNVCNVSEPGWGYQKTEHSIRVTCSQLCNHLESCQPLFTFTHSCDPLCPGTFLPSKREEDLRVESVKQGENQRSKSTDMAMREDARIRCQRMVFFVLKHQL